jgi:hypothetical protein
MATILLCILFIFIPSEQTHEAAFFNALSSSDMQILDDQIVQLKKSTSSAKINAYLGTMLMKRSAFENSIGDKISMFKEGHKMLEEQIQANPDNTEYRFLRLAVQENAPSILGYNSNIDEDKALLLKNFKTLSSELKTYILNYSNVSTILSSEELKING